MNRFAQLLLPALALFFLPGCALLGALAGNPSGGGGGDAAPSNSLAAGGVTFNASPASIFDEAELSTKLGLLGPAALLSENGQLDLVVMSSAISIRRIRRS